MLADKTAVPGVTPMSINNQDLTVSLASCRDLPDIVAQAIVDLAAPALGPGYLDRQTLEVGNRVVAYALHDSGRLAGFAMGRALAGQQYVREHPTAERAIQRLGDIGGLAETVVVSPDARGHGLGTHLMKDICAHITALSGAPLILPAWRHHDGTVPADGLARHLGFVPYAIVNDYWFDESCLRGYMCPSCGNPCRCAARLYVLSQPDHSGSAR